MTLLPPLPPRNRTHWKTVSCAPPRLVVVPVLPIRRPSEGAGPPMTESLPNLIENERRVLSIPSPVTFMPSGIDRVPCV